MLVGICFVFSVLFLAFLMAARKIVFILCFQTPRHNLERADDITHKHKPPYECDSLPNRHTHTCMAVSWKR